MVKNTMCGGRALSLAVGITMLVLLMSGGVQARFDLNISPHGDINNSFIMHRLDAGITYNRDLGIQFRNATGELTSIGVKNESRYGRIQENKKLLPVKGIEKAAVKISAKAGWFISDTETGGDCTFIGTWNIISKTCTLTTDLNKTIVIDSDNITLDGNSHTITGSSSEYGIYLSGRSGVTIKNTNVRYFYDGIYLHDSNNNTLNGNNALNNTYGIYLYYSSNNNLFNNTMKENSYNFVVYGWSDSHFNNQIDSSNTVDGKPIYYVINAKNTVYDSSTNAGFFYCISCLNVTIKDIELLKNDVGILFWNTTFSKIQNVTVSNNGDGIVLLESSNNMVIGNNLNLNEHDGIYLEYSYNNTLIGNNANSNNGDGIYLYESGNNSLSGNNANSNNYVGIDLYESGNNSLSGNNASNNSNGIYLEYSYNNTLFDNTMAENSFNFGLYGMSDSDYNNQIDYSNTLDGKPIYYIKNANNTVYDSSTNAGIFYCISCLNVTIKDIELLKNEVGILFWNTTVSKIQNVTVSNNYDGIELYLSSNNALSGNNASNNYGGIVLWESGNNTLSGNNVNSNHEIGIVVYESGNNTLSNNNALNDNYYGIVLLGSGNNTLSENNANSDNEVGVVLLESSNNMLSGNNASNNYDGIVLLGSTKNTMDGNTALNNYEGIYLEYSSSNTLIGNIASNNTNGIYLDYSSNNKLFDNTMTENSFNFGLYGWSDSDFINQIDSSNTVDGKPIFYVLNAKNTVYDSSTNAGIFYCISCLNVTIKDIELLKNDFGILFWNTTISKIQNVTVSKNDDGIVLLDSSNNTLSDNNVNSNKDDGIYMGYSSNNTLSGNNVNSNKDDGIYLGYSSNNTLSRNNASNNIEDGISLYYSDSNNIIGNNLTLNEDCGIYLEYSSNNNLSWNNARENNDSASIGEGYGDGIYLSYSGNNTLIGNNASTNTYGIFLDNSSNNILFNNIMKENSFNFGVWGWSDSDYNNQIDYSNTVDGKPIYYVKNAYNTVYDSSANAGVFYCISCLNVTIKDIKLLKNDVGILFWNTTFSKIQNVTASKNYDGIDLLDSSNNMLNGNNAKLNEYDGIYLYNSNNNTLNDNNPNSNIHNGIHLTHSSNNILSGNNASYNIEDGIYLSYSSINLIYNNHFNNTNNSGFSGSNINTWNTTLQSGTNIIGGSYMGGNFWANPSGTGFGQTCADANSDEGCDSEYVLDSNNIDYLPLSINLESAVPLPIDPVTGKVNTTIITMSGNVSITIPNGTAAVDETGNSLTNISIDACVSLTTNATLKLSVNDGVTGNAIELKPEGARFDPPIQIRFNYSLPLPSGVDENSLTVHYFNTYLNGWEDMYTVERNTAQHYIIANISHFSTFALIGTKPISGGGASSDGGTYPPGYDTTGTTKTSSPTVTATITPVTTMATPVTQGTEMPTQTAQPEVTVTRTAASAPTAKSPGFGTIIAVSAIAMVVSLLKNNRNRR